jgi:hypothetical protein
MSGERQVMAPNRTNHEHSDRLARREYLESYQRLIANWIDAIVDQQSKATLAEFNAANQRKTARRLSIEAVVAESQ